MKDLDMQMARRMAFASACAYQIYDADVIPTPNDPNLKRVKGGDDRFFYQVMAPYQDAVGFVADTQTGAPDFIACSRDLIDGALVGTTTDGYAVVAIRGTLPPSFKNNDVLEWMTDWLDDADMHPVDWTVAGASFGRVEHGFAKAALALWPFVKSRLEAVMPKAPKGVLITGHSKGGAVTFLLASLIQAQWPELADRIEVHAFAPALSCGRSFLSHYDAAGLSARSYRYQTAHDLVPFVPLWHDLDVWSAVFRASHSHRLLWGGMAAAIYALAKGGYGAPGRFVFFDADQRHVPNADPASSALPMVVDALAAGDYGKIGAAHSMTHSYLPCFDRWTSAER